MARRTTRPELTPEQRVESDRILATPRQAAASDLRELADLLATKDDSNTFGAAEFTVRDSVPRVGAKAVETALEGRKKGVRRLLPYLPPLPRGRQVPALAASSADLTGVGMQGDGGSAVEGRMAAVGMVWNAGEPGQVRSVCGLTNGLAVLGEPLRKQAA